MAAIIQINYSQNFPADAIPAVDRARAAWAQVLTSTQIVRINAYWDVPLPDLVAMCIPNGIENFPNCPIADTWYTSALADKLCGQDCQPGVPDMAICFNSVEFTFNTNERSCPRHEHDLQTNALHEMGHGFGVVGLFWLEQGTKKGSYGSSAVVGAIPGDLDLPFPRPVLDDHPSAFGRLVADANDRLLTNETYYTNNSVELGAALQSDGLAIAKIPGGVGRRAIFSPRGFMPFSSGDHFSANSLMIPFIKPGTRIPDIDEATRGVLTMMGW